MFTFLFSGKQKEVLSVVYDIGSASVGGALVFHKDGRNPKIIYTTRRDLPFQEKLSVVRLKTAVVDAVGSVSRDLEKNGLRHLTFTPFGMSTPSTSFISFSSPWFTSQTTIISEKKDSPFVVTRKMIEEMAEREIDSFKDSEEVKKIIGQDTSAIIEKRIVSVKLNGYTTGAPYGKKARSIELAIFMSIVPNEILNGISDNIRKTFSVEDMEVSSFPFAAFDVIRNIKKDEDLFLFIDISGELTDVSLVSEDILLDIVSFPVGKKTIVRRLSKELRVGSDEAVSILRMYERKESSDKEKKRVEYAIERAGNEWLMSFTKTLESIAKEFSVPQAVYITADKDVEDWFVDLVAREEFGQYTMSSQNFTIHKINSAFLKEAYRHGNVSVSDPFLSIGAIFLNRLII